MKKLTKILSTSLFGVSVLATSVPTTSCDAAKNSMSSQFSLSNYVGDIKGENWRGRIAGSLYLVKNERLKTVSINYQNDYEAHNLIVPSEVLDNGVKYTVVSIGDYAFSKCEGLTGSLTISGSVRIIGESAFNSCLQLTSVTIPQSVEEIGVAAFKNCGLESLDLTNFKGKIDYVCFSENRISNLLPPVNNDNYEFIKYENFSIFRSKIHSESFDMNDVALAYGSVDKNVIQHFKIDMSVSSLGKLGPFVGSSISELNIDGYNGNFNYQSFNSIKTLKLKDDHFVFGENRIQRIAPFSFTGSITNNDKLSFSANDNLEYYIGEFAFAGTWDSIKELNLSENLLIDNNCFYLPLLEKMNLSNFTGEVRDEGFIGGVNCHEITINSEYEPSLWKAWSPQSFIGFSNEGVIKSNVSFWEEQGDILEFFKSKGLDTTNWIVVTE